MPSETSRIEAFSDGVFSIAATLLGLELKPPAAGVPFWNGIVAQWPAYASFLLSFLFIGIMWMNHHRLFNHIRRADDALMLSNLLLLLGVVWIPYPTLLLAQAYNTGHLRDAAVLYNGSYVAIALLYNLELSVTIRHGLVDRDYSKLANLRRSYLVGPLFYLGCLALTWWNVTLSLAVNAAVALFFLLTPEKRLPRSSGETM